MIDFSTLQQPKKPNAYIVLPPAFDCPAAADRVSPIYDETALALFDRISGIIAQTPGWALADTDPANYTLRFVATTLILRFKDDVHIKTFPAPSGTQSYVAIFSQSRVGYSDLGANKKRIDGFLKFL